MIVQASMCGVYGEDKLDEAEIKARENDKSIESIRDRDQSFEHRRLLNKYIDDDGKILKAIKTSFENERAKLIKQVFETTHMLFVTCNNAGSEFVRLGFDPSAIYVDEAGQLTMAAFANVLTSFSHWLSVTIFGDPCQLLPFHLSGPANEFKKNAILSVLALLEEKGYPVLRLEYQYRMAPAISRWVSQFFYKGLLKNHKSVFVDSPYRQIVRQISRELYIRAGPTGTGSEYWMIDVVNGISRVQNNGTSLQNYANADRLAILVDQILAKGVDVSKITVLGYYTGQSPLVSYKIEKTTTANGRQWKYSSGQTISSVDSFQGEEHEFIFIDLVVAHQQLQRTAPNIDADESEEDDGSEGFKRSGRVTSHVKSANRLCCALTRGRSCVVVVCQLSAIVSTVKSMQQKSKAAISAMAQDFLNRGSVYHDYDSLDTSLIGESMCKTWDDARLQQTLRNKKAESLDFLSTQMNKARTARYTEESQNTALKLYRTSTGKTTRPNKGNTARAADTRDIEFGRIEPVLQTSAGAVSVTVGPQSQRSTKNTNRAAAAARKVAEEVETAGTEKAKGKGKEAAPGKAVGGKAVEEPDGGKGKGKGKEVETGEDKMDEN